MCRLFGLSAAPNRVDARFWLLEAPDSLVEQSRRNAGGTGLGLVLASSREPWVLRYSDPDRLFVLDRAAGGIHCGRPPNDTSATPSVHSKHLADRSSVLLASEPLDEHSGWRLLEVGELLPASAHLAVTSQFLIEDPPATRMHVSSLHDA